MPDSAKFCQTTFRETFSSEGRFAGQTIDDVATALKSGKMSPKDVPFEIYVPEQGNALILNTRSAQALTRAGMPRSQWNAIVMNENGNAMERMLEQLVRNSLSFEGFANPVPLP